MRIGLLLVVSVLVTAGSVIPVQADDCDDKNCWVAIASGPRYWGGWARDPDEGVATRMAKEKCEGHCTVIRTFKGTCGAMTVGSHGEWAFAANKDVVEAQILALRDCAEKDSYCAVVSWECSD